MDISKTSTSDGWFFSVNQTYSRTADNYMVHVLRSTYTPSTLKNCTSEVVTETCVIEIGQIDYNIEVKGTQVTVLPRPSSEWTSNNISRTETHDAPTAKRPGPLWALGYMATYFGSWSGWEANSTQMLTFGILSEQLFIYTPQGNSSLCISDYKWSNRTDYILNGMGVILFRLAMNGDFVTNLTVLSAPNGIFPQPQTFQAYRIHEIIFYKSDYKWLGVALGAVLLNLIALSTTLPGSRNISRAVTLSPIETFQVFSPEVGCKLHSRSNTDFGYRTQNVLARIGDTMVQYKPMYSPVDTRKYEVEAGKPPNLQCMPIYMLYTQGYRSWPTSGSDVECILAWIFCRNVDQCGVDTGPLWRTGGTCSPRLTVSRKAEMTLSIIISYNYQCRAFSIVL